MIARSFTRLVLSSTVALGALAAPALAQDAPDITNRNGQEAASESGAIIVTGSRIKQDPTKSALPLQIITNADIERAGLAMISAESEEPIPDSVARTDTELRVAKTALAQLEQQIQTVKDELANLPEQLREAMQAFQRCLATVAEVEMKEQVHSLAAVFAKASVTAYLRNFQGAPNKLEIEIPDDAVEAMRSELEAEVMDD